MKNHKIHNQDVKQLQAHIRFLAKEKKAIALHYCKGHSNTTRSKSYKKNGFKLDCSALNQILEIDIHKQIITVEPRVTMEELVQATLPLGFVVPVIPEFKGITVGGAIMGGAAESSSHRWGIFNDVCTAYEFLTGEGELIRVSPTEEPDLFYGIAGSYGTLGLLVKAELKLVPAQKWVHLRTHVFSDPMAALTTIQEASHKSPDFLDGIVFDKELAVVIEGKLNANAAHLPQFSLASTSSWYYNHVKEIATKSGCSTVEECMSLEDYLFRYDRGAFWMGSYLFHPTLLTRLISQGIFKFSSSCQIGFDEHEIRKFYSLPPPKPFLYSLANRYMNSQVLWKVLHKAEKWVKDRFIIQDFCIPSGNAHHFLKEVIEDPSVFPLWLCPIKGTSTPQLFSPHLLSTPNETSFINIGVYGLPSYAIPIQKITRFLEKRTENYGGRKVLYSHSYYTEDEFWNIYSQKSYNILRKKSQAEGIWPEITQKVLSD